jgi:hypothetical protein
MPPRATAKFYCDVAAGDRPHVLKSLDFVDKTSQDFAAFLADKPKPLGIILYDCILRRLGNGPSLARLKTFAGIPAAGFSTFGELLGITSTRRFAPSPSSTCRPARRFATTIPTTMRCTMAASKATSRAGGWRSPNFRRARGGG